MKSAAKQLLMCLFGASIVYVAGVVSYSRMEGFGWIFLDVYGILFWVNGFFTLLEKRKKYRSSSWSTEAGRMTVEWPWWRVLWHRLKGHEITNSGENYPPAVCRTCELARLCNHGAAMTIKDEGGKVLSLYCSKCDLNIGAGQSSDRKME